jgi:hypothetical protein
MAATITGIQVTLRGQVGADIVALAVTAPGGATVQLTIAADRTWSHQVPVGASAALYTFTTVDAVGRTRTRTVTVEPLASAPTVIG